MLGKNTLMANAVLAYLAVDVIVARPIVDKCLVIEHIRADSIQAFFIFFAYSGGCIAGGFIVEINIAGFVAAGLAGVGVIKVLSIFFVEAAYILLNNLLITLLEKVLVAGFFGKLRTNCSTYRLFRLTELLQALSLFASESFIAFNVQALIINFNTASVKTSLSLSALDIQTFPNVGRDISFSVRLDLSNVITLGPISSLGLNHAGQDEEDHYRKLEFSHRKQYIWNFILGQQKNKMALYSKIKLLEFQMENSMPVCESGRHLCLEIERQGKAVAKAFLYWHI